MQRFKILTQGIFQKHVSTTGCIIKNHPWKKIRILSTVSRHEKTEVLRAKNWNLHQIPPPSKEKIFFERKGLFEEELLTAFLSAPRGFERKTVWKKIPFENRTLLKEYIFQESSFCSSATELKGEKVFGKKSSRTKFLFLLLLKIFDNWKHYFRTPCIPMPIPMAIPIPHAKSGVGNG